MITTEVKTDGLMTQLSEEIIETYDTGTDGKAVEDIIDDLLAFQRKATKIEKGTISPVGTRTLEVTNRTIQAALLQLQESVGGFMDVDNDRLLQWPTTIGEDKGQQIRYRKNLIGITRDIDYGGYCTKLHPSGGNESLSDISKSRVDVDKDSDASYGYLTLKETYACYKDWTGAGDALPSHVEIYEKDEIVWESPIDYHDPEGAWTNETNAYDENTGTYTYTNVGGHDLSEYLILEASAVPAGAIEALGVRIMFSNIPAEGMLLKIWVSDDGVDYTLVVTDSLGAADNGVWQEYTFDKRAVFNARINFLNYNAGAISYRINEFDFKTEKEVTADFVQGADERTFRCDIGDYNAGADYIACYQYANYLMAWDKIVDDDDIVAKAVTNKYEAYAISMLEGAILLLDELKEVPITYTIRAVDLSKNRDFNFDFEALQLGSVLTIIDEDLGIDVSVRVVSLEHPDLLDPQNINIELSTRVKDISDYLADLHKEFG
ncbi:phage tail protein [Patescibacteria group bacterium]|nr:phage tail protein [Patescibacteria group bacterium]